ncbi:MAG: hypothetical protein HN413_08110 [Chloroflexi bacterium]|nr:hypothetical protein [Chloroflexota bacterium]
MKNIDKMNRRLTKMANNYLYTDIVKAFGSIGIELPAESHKKDEYFQLNDSQLSQVEQYLETQCPKK